MDKTDKITELDFISLKASLLMSQLEILEIRIQLLLQSFEAKQQKKYGENVLKFHYFYLN